MESYPPQCQTDKGALFVEILEEPITPPDEPIGGQRDEHGCLGPAGYTWNENFSACAREWEIDDVELLVVHEAVAYVKSDTTVTVVGVQKGECEGCFRVYLERGEERKPLRVNIVNWKAEGAEEIDILSENPELTSIKASCEAVNGIWLAEYNECEYVSEEWCNQNNGLWHECESACRHDPEAEICTMQCVTVCRF